MLIRTPPEKIVRRAHEIGIFNADMFLRTRKTVVQLACGHYCVTRNAKAAVCLRCSEMLRRSIETGEEDYETFRCGNGIDRMDWQGDPCAVFNQAASHGQSVLARVPDKLG